MGDGCVQDAARAAAVCVGEPAKQSFVCGSQSGEPGKRLF